MFLFIVVQFFHLIVEATYSKLYVYLGPERQLLAKCSSYSQFPYFIYCSSLLFHSRYLAVAKMIALPKTANLMTPSTSNIWSYNLCLLLCPLYFLLPKSH